MKKRLISEVLKKAEALYYFMKIAIPEKELFMEILQQFQVWLDRDIENERK